MGRGGILIVGGYGLVGSRIATDLAPDFPERIIVAGRSRERAGAAAEAIGDGVRGRALDVTVPVSIAAALDDVSVVVSCVDQPERRLLGAAIERGLGYTDIAPHLTELGRGGAYERIDAAARKSGARVVLGTGLVPGISNLMVRALADTLGGAETIETSLLLSARDAAGPASFDYFLQELAMPFTVHVHGSDQNTQTFSDPRAVEFPPPFGVRPSYLFPFSDQVLYPRTMGANAVRSRLALDPPRFAALLSLLVRTRVVGILKSRRVRRRIAAARGKRTPSEDAQFALRVDVTNGNDARHATLVGRAQAKAAAAGATSVARSLLDGEVAEPGAWMPEQVIDPPRFFAHLARHGFAVDSRELSQGGGSSFQQDQSTSRRQSAGPRTG